MGPLNIALWLAGVALIAHRLLARPRPVGALPGAQGAGRERRPLRGVARRHPRRQHDRRVGRHGDPPAPGADRRRDRDRRGRPGLSNTWPCRGYCACSSFVVLLAVPTVTARLLNRTGQLMADVPVQTPPGRSAEIDLPLSALAAGEYIVEVTGKTPSGTAQELIAFRIAR